MEALFFPLRAAPMAKKQNILCFGIIFKLRMIRTCVMRYERYPYVHFPFIESSDTVGYTQTVDCMHVYVGWAKRKKVPSSMRKMHRFRFIPRMRKVSSGHLLSIHVFYSVQWFCKQGPDQTARMRTLIWAFSVRICLKTYFRMARSLSGPSLSAYRIRVIF